MVPSWVPSIACRVLQKERGVDFDKSPYGHWPKIILTPFLNLEVTLQAGLILSLSRWVGNL